MASEKRFQVFFTDADIFDVRLRLEDSRVTELTINYRAIINEEWVEVTRYDTCHGHLHVHKNWLAPGREIQDLENPRARNRNYAEIAARAIDDLKKNWRKYRKHMEART